MSQRRNPDLFFALLAAFSIPLAAQQQRFAGVWEATFKGNVFMVLKLQTGEPLSGTLSGGSFSVNSEGDLTEASGGGKELPISNAKIDGDRLSFDWKDSDDETLKLEMQLIGDGEAQLRFVSAPEDAKIKPFPLKRK
jgi:hypothetical protein